MAASDVEPQRIERLYVRGFRNLATLDLTPGPRFNVFHGDNGAGKSSLLEAIHYLGALESFRSARTDDLVRIGENEALLKARVSASPLPRVFEAALSRTAPRRVRVDQKKPRSIADYHAQIHVVAFHPGDLELASGAAEGRRAFLDRMLEQMSVPYATARAAYDRALRSRNRLLKDAQVDRRSIVAYDALLADSGAVIVRERASLVRELSPRVEAAFEDVIGAELPLTVRYRPRVEGDAEALRRALHASFEKDCARGFTAEGPHGDDISLEMKKVAAQRHASQGQHRAIVLALKIAELDVLAERTRTVPMLLLDDVSSELDRSRNRRLFERLSRMGGQVFLTTTHPEFILLEENRVDFGIEGGRVVAG